ncbi:MAG: DUF2098 domain-containing protein [Methanomicrobiaceae archaeon]|nr:DUF2098 domain-containing protein [Methanomicrobiaceae archaeon]
MQDEEISVGDVVRYPRTGTTGRVSEVKKSGKFYFAKLDSTGLLYRTDLLIPAKSVKKLRESGEKTDIDRLIRPEDLSSEDISDAFDDVTGVGAG